MRCSLSEWNEFLEHYPDAHILQSGEWGELKSRFGWRVVRIIKGSIGTQILYRKLPLGLHIGYLGKGPVGGKLEDISQEIDDISRELHAIFLKVEPDGWQADEVQQRMTLTEDWKTSKPIQPQRTVMVSLKGSDEEILSRMKQKTRYNIRLAVKKGVSVRPDDDLSAFAAMMKVTGQRDHFGVHSQEYYQSAYNLFHTSGNCELFTAFYGEKRLASIMVFARGKNSWYMYGASTDELRNFMPTYLLQWQAMLWAKSRGCEEYDLWGIPDLDEDELEESFTQKESHQGLWGVYRFKRGFGGEILRSNGAFDRIYNSFFYNLYQWAVQIHGGSEG